MTRASILLMLAVLLPQEPPKPAPTPAPPPPAASAYVAIVGGNVLTIREGVLKGATVLIKDGKIHRVGMDVEIPEGAERHDAVGRWVMPGLVAVSARGLGFSGNSTKIADALDPFQPSILLALAAGITTAHVEAGGGGMFGGRTQGIQTPTAVIKMTYGDLESMLVAEPATVSMTWALQAAPAQRHELRENLKKARDLVGKIRDYDARKAAGKVQPNEQPPAPGPLEPYVRLLRGDAPGRFEASGADQIAAALSLIEEFRFKAVLLGADEAWTLTEEIGRAHALCAITPRRRRSEDKRSARPSGSRFEQPAMLRKAGVRFAIAPLSDVIDTGGLGGRDLQALLMEAAFAVRGGLDEKSALEAVTLGAAEAIGAAHRIGSLEEGKDADVLVLDREPLDYRALVEKTFVNGKLRYDIATSPWFSHLRKK